MNFEDLQKSWQAQDAGRKITINADLLLKEVRHNQQSFRRIIFWRDVREVGVAAILVPVFIAAGLKVSWTLHLCAFGCLVVGSYFLLDRWRQRKKTTDLHGSLKDCAATSLAEVSHQIWLLKNVIWWYLMPIFVPIMIFFGWVAWQLPVPAGEKIMCLLPHTSFVVLLYAGIYWLNQCVVKKQLEPRRRELEELLAELESGTPPILMKTKKPFGPLILVLAVSLLALATVPLIKATSSSPAGLSLADICRRHHLPGIAVVVTKDGQICDCAVAGVRKWGDATPMTTTDLVHIGSCTKSMTATLAGVLIDEGKLRWDMTIGEVFPEWEGQMDKEYETVTLEQLLHHRGGVPGEPPDMAWAQAIREAGTPREQRREFVQAVLSKPPAAPPGSKMIYSNQGYAIVGVIMEQVTGQDYETLITEKLFKPLHMVTAGFGPPSTNGAMDQPWGHVRKLLMTFPLQADNPPAVTPAGRVHASMEDLARYAMLHLAGATNGLLKPETMVRLHTPVPDPGDPTGNYACGWVILKRGWAGGDVLWHNGSNTMWYIVMWVAPEKNFSVIVATNIAGNEAEQGCDDAAVAMIHKWLPQ